MSRALTPPTFIDAAGQEYRLYLTVLPPEGDAFPLDNAMVRQLDYRTALNDLVVRGQLVYTDVGGVMDSLLCRPGGAVRMSFTRTETEEDGDIAERHESETAEFEEDFAVESVGIVDRQKDVITYKLALASVNISRCISTLDFTNYGRPPEPVLDILRHVAEKAGLEVDADSFEAVKHQPKMNYITNGNDTLFTASKFLLDKLYYRFPRSGSMVFVFWNEFKKKLQLFDMSNSDSITGVTNVTLSMFDTPSESFAGGPPAELGTVTKFPVSDAAACGYFRRIASYDYKTNRFEYENVRPEDSYGFMNSRFEQAGEVDDKYGDVMNAQGQLYEKRGSYWNNDFHMYGQFVDTFLNNNALLVKTAGDVSRRPGGIVNVDVDRGDAQQYSEDPVAFEQMLRKFRGLDGPWVVAKVHHCLKPASPEADRYRQTLTLVRNFVVPPGDGSE